MASVSSMSAPSQGYCGFKTFIDHQSKCNRFNRVQVINITAAVERILTQLKNGTFPKAKQLPAYIRKVVAAPKTKNLSVYYDPDGSVLLIFKFMNPKGHDPKKIWPAVVLDKEKNVDDLEVRSWNKFTLKGLDQDSILRQFKSELSMLRMLQFEHVLKFISEFAFDGKDGWRRVGFTTEWCIEDFRESSYDFTQDELKMLTEQLLSILVFLEQSQAHHRDLTPSNLMRDCDGNLKLIDFGYALTLEEERKGESNFSGTSFFVSPDYVQGHSIVDFTRASTLLDSIKEMIISAAFDGLSTTLSDVWSAGIILFMFHYKRHPFAGLVATSSDGEYESRYLALLKSHASLFQQTLEAIPELQDKSIPINVIITNMLQTQLKDRWYASQAMQFHKENNTGQSTETLS